MPVFFTSASVFTALRRDESLEGGGGGERRKVEGEKGGGLKQDSQFLSASLVRQDKPNRSNIMKR
jgi:hypothetical protein